MAGPLIAAASSLDAWSVHSTFDRSIEFKAVALWLLYTILYYTNRKV